MVVHIIGTECMHFDHYSFSNIICSVHAVERITANTSDAVCYTGRSFPKKVSAHVC